MVGSWWRACGAPGAVGLLLAAAAACAQPVGVDPAPSASEPVCAELLLDLPNELGGQERRSTTSQASRAWGDPAIVLRCGVRPLPPTTDGCVALTTEDGTKVDWVVTEDEQQARFVTYGRLPAVEVTVPGEYAGDQTIMTELSAVVVGLPQDGDRECL